MRYSYEFNRKYVEIYRTKRYPTTPISSSKLFSNFRKQPCKNQIQIFLAGGHGF